MSSRSSAITEIALRAAVNQVGIGDTTDGIDLVRKIGSAAKNKAQNLVMAQSDSETRIDQLNIQGASIDLAIKGLVLAAVAVHEQINTMHKQRLSFDKERIAGIATFIVPTNKEYTKLSHEEKVIQDYVKFLRVQRFVQYFGLNSQLLVENIHAEYHSVLPFYRMSEHIKQPVASTKLLDEKRVLINLFFKSALPSQIADIDHDFTTDNPVLAFFESAWERENYLNNLRAPRLIMMSLSNLLWHLQDPVDEEGFPLSVTKRISLCKEVLKFLNKLLNPRDEPYICQLDNNKMLTAVIQRIELHVKGLLKAFIDEKVNAINVEGITISTHLSLRKMDTSVFKLLYKCEKPGKEGFTSPDPKAAQQLASTIGYMDELFDMYPDLINAFVGGFEGAPKTFVNTPPRTIIDALIIFVHSTRSEKDRIITRLEALKSESGKQMAGVFRGLDYQFIIPIKNKVKEELGLKKRNHDHRRRVAQETARRLLPLFTLVLEDFRIDVTTVAGGCGLLHSNEPFSEGILSGDMQVRKINRSADSDAGYYHWTLSSFIKSSDGFADKIDLLPKKQFRLTKISELLDNLKSFIYHYRSFLAYPQFQRFLIACISDIKEEYVDLGDFVTDLDLSLNHDEFLSREIKSILIPLTEDLQKTIMEFNESVILLKNRISSPDFPLEQKAILKRKVRDLSEQYKELFKKEAKIENIIEIPEVTELEDDNSKVLLPSAVHPDTVPNQLMVSLTLLIKNCENSMSPYMANSHKTMMIRGLMTALKRKSNCRKSDVEGIVRELAKIVMAYRPSYLFQAAYGETRSTKALCHEIMRHHDDDEFPLPKLLFGDDLSKIDLTSEKSIMEAMKALSQQLSWQKQAPKLTLSNEMLTSF